MLDFLSGVFELFTVTDDFLRYGWKRIRILRRAYRHGGWQQVRRVSAGRKAAIAVWLVLVVALAAVLAFAWIMIALVLLLVFR